MIGDAGLKELTQVLEKNTTLTELRLWDNPISTEGTQYIGVINVFIARNKLLIPPWFYTMDLSNKKISDAGAKELAQILYNNTFLRELDLAINEIKDVGAKELAQALLNNTSLTVLNLRCNKIGDAGAKRISTGTA